HPESVLEEVRERSEDSGEEDAVGQRRRGEDRRDLRQMRLSDGDEMGALRALSRLFQLSRVQNHATARGCFGRRARSIGGGFVSALSGARGNAGSEEGSIRLFPGLSQVPRVQGHEETGAG